MAEVYASIIIKGIKTINDIPSRIRDDVKVALINRGRPDLANGD